VGGLVVGRNELLYVWSLIKIVLLFSFLNILIVLAGLGISAVVGGPDALESGTSDGTWFAGVLALYFGSIFVLLPLMARSALVFPHVALGNRSELREMWRRTKGNGWRLAGYFILVILTATICSWLVLLPIYSLIGGGIFPTPEQLIHLRENTTLMLAQYLLGIPFTLVWTMLTITMLSVAYREIVGLPGAAGGEPAA